MRWNIAMIVTTALLQCSRPRGRRIPDTRPTAATLTRKSAIAGIDFRISPHDMSAVGLERSRPAFPRHFAQALHFARSPGRGLLAKCHPRPDVRNQVPGPSTTARSAAAQPSVVSLRFKEMRYALCQSTLRFLGPPSNSNTLEGTIQIPRWDYRSH